MDTQDTWVQKPKHFKPLKRGLAKTLQAFLKLAAGFLDVDGGP
jgi:hypothetical protein